jgi:Nucleotidyl transferase AbiEii toxin, Type IV TA system
VSDLPSDLQRILPADTGRAWLALAGRLPDELCLGGGTAVAAHLGHRESRDLDFFFERAVDLSRVKALLGKLGVFAVTYEDEGTLRGIFGETKIEIFDARGLNRLAEPMVIAGLTVAALQDLMAMKLKVMAERGEMRDYFDVKAIDESGSVSVEEGIDLYMTRYGIDPSSEALPHLYRSMGDLSDVEADESLSIDLAELGRWWSARQVRALRNSDRFG